MGCRQGAPAPSRVAALLLLVLLAAGPCAGQKNKRVPELSNELLQDREGLLALERAVTDPGLSKMRTWSADGNPCFPKPWKHVTCAGGRVASLNLANLKLQGTLPRQLRLLDALVTLDLGGNSFTGRLPEGWADPNFFLALRVLSLQNNALSGSLPNRKWNSAKAWPSLEELDLSGNQFWGGLPDGWLSTAKVFKNLRYLDLSGNCLGYSDACKTQMDATTAWCLAGSQSSTGWCPSGNPLPGTMAKLETLDISDNGLVGALPLKWPRMFPSLKYFYIANNALTATSTATPAVLPAEWTRVRVPRAFPKLQTLVMYPGNPNLCFLPDGDNDGNGFVDVAGATTFTVADTDLRPYDTQDPFNCPPAAVDNPPTGLAADQLRNGALLALFIAPSAADTPTAVYGYKVTIHTQDPDTEEWAPLTAWNGRLLRTYQAAALPAGLTRGSATPADYTLDTGVVLNLGTAYRIRITTLNMDGWESAPAQLAFTATAKKWGYGAATWGGFNAGSSNVGQLGLGSTTSQTAPVLTITGNNWGAAVAGGMHTCVLEETDRTAYCFGFNSHGQLGDGTQVNRDTPTPVAPPTGSSTPLQFASIAPSASDGAGAHTCGITMNMDAYCWGRNGDGQLGNTEAPGASKLVPNKVVTSLKFKAIATGFYHTCAIASDDSLYCWGAGNNDQIGTTRPAFGSASKTTPTAILQVQGVTLKFAAVAAGSEYTCGILLPPASTIYCFGRNNAGQLGADSTAASSATPLPVAGGAASVKFASLSLGTYHACAVAVDNGDIWCWGLGDRFQLGTGQKVSTRMPVLASSATGPWSTVAAGDRATCAIRAADKSAWCWGSNDFGQIGDGSTSEPWPGTNNPRPSATRVLGDGKWQSVSLGFYHAVGLRTAA